MTDAAENAPAGEQARAVAFAVAQAARGGDDHALRALDVLLLRAPQIAVSDNSTLVNLLTALQFASMLPDGHRASSVLSSDAVARTIEIGLRSGKPQREQAEELLWMLADRGLVTDWLGREVIETVAFEQLSFDLREELMKQVRRREYPISFVPAGAEFPSVAA